MKAKINLANIGAYITGWIRYYLYYSKFKFLIRKHILEQIDFRIKYMDKECYENGSCKLCGCATTALQMANKQCDKPCYPPILKQQEWETFQAGNRILTPLYMWQLNDYYFGQHPDQFKVMLRMNIHTPFIEKVLPNDRETYKNPQQLEAKWKEYNSQEDYNRDKTNNDGEESPLVSILNNWWENNRMKEQQTNLDSGLTSLWDIEDRDIFLSELDNLSQTNLRLMDEPMEHKIVHIQSNQKRYEESNIPKMNPGVVFISSLHEFPLITTGESTLGLLWNDFHNAWCYNICRDRKGNRYDQVPIFNREGKLIVTVIKVLE